MCVCVCVCICVIFIHVYAVCVCTCLRTYMHACMHACVICIHVFVYSPMTLLRISSEYLISQHSHLQDFTYLKVNMLDSEEETLIDHYQKCASFIDQGRKLGKVLIHW